jgi:hypothetical protein
VCLATASIAFASERLHPPVGDHAVCFPSFSEPWDCMVALAPHQDEARAAVSDARLERSQRVQQELDPVRELSRSDGGEEIGIEDEDRDDLAAASRVAERKVIGDAQVLAAKPDDGPHALVISDLRNVAASS